jgi:hypothetical protein
MMECDRILLSDKYSSRHKLEISQQWNATPQIIYRKLFVINGTHTRECELSAGALVCQYCFKHILNMVSDLVSVPISF